MSILNNMYTWVKDIRLGLQRRRYGSVYQGQLVLAAAVFGVVGFYLLAGSHAATPSVSLEAENGSGGQIFSDSTASGGKAIQFSGPTYYVTSSGSDANDGSAATPWQTVQKAVDTAPASSTISLASGTYAPFKVTRPNLAITGVSGAVVSGSAGVQNVIDIKANNITIKNLAVSGCVPSSSPPGSFEQQGSAQVKVDAGTSGTTLDGLSIHDSHGTNSDGLPFGCYGVLILKAAWVTVKDSDIYHNGAGIGVNTGGDGIVIENNTIHDNDVIIRNTVANTNDDFGGSAVGVSYTQNANPGPMVRDNTMYMDIGPSHDYGTDGGATEIYASTNVTFQHNTMHDNDDVFESGTSNGAPCSGNKFIDNTAYGKAANSTLKVRTPGMYVRCALLIDGNTFTKLNYYAIAVVGGGVFGGLLNGLTITNNTFDQTPRSGTTISEKTYALNTDPTGLGFVINNNHYHYLNSFGSNWDNTSDASLAAWQAKTGFDANSTTY